MSRDKKELNDETRIIRNHGGGIQPEQPDEKFDDMVDEDELTPSQARSALAVKVIAAVTAFIFIFIIMANVLRIVTFPSLDFLKESRELADDPVLQDLQQAVVQVLYVDREGYTLPTARRKGTGFNIHPAGLIVTNKHVIEGAHAVTVSFEEGGTYVASHWTKSDRLDLALLFLDLNQTAGNGTAGSNLLPHVELQRDSFPEVGAEVIIMGNPLGFRQVISRGIISAFHSHADLPYPLIVIEAPIHAGSSGSPVFDSENKVIAVVYAVLRQDSQDDNEKIKGLAIPVKYLEEILENPLLPNH